MTEIEDVNHMFEIVKCIDEGTDPVVWGKWNGVREVSDILLWLSNNFNFKQFFIHTRMMRAVFDYLVELLKSFLTKNRARISFE